MRAVVQRVIKGSVTVGEKTVGSINKGLVVLVGIAGDDTEDDAKYIADKIANLRIFEDLNSKLNYSVIDIKGDILAVSQFTLLGDCRKGRRPSFSEAAPAEAALNLYNYFIDILRGYGINVSTGRFQTTMLVEIHNDGPVTLLLDSKKKF